MGQSVIPVELWEQLEQPACQQIRSTLLSCSFKGSKTERLPTSALAIFMSVAILSQLGNAMAPHPCGAHNFVKYGECCVAVC